VDIQERGKKRNDKKKNRVTNGRKRGGTLSALQGQDNNYPPPAFLNKKRKEVTLKIANRNLKSI
jgi:hypothetical protein